MKQSKIAFVGHTNAGKSSIIGRLLIDSHSIKSDRKYKFHSDGSIKYASLTDAFISENFKTVDCSYQYIHKKHTIVLIDCPGHAEYYFRTLTGLSQSDRAFLVYDGRFTTYIKGLIRQMNDWDIPYSLILNKSDRREYLPTPIIDFCRKENLATPKKVFKVSTKTGKGFNTLIKEVLCLRQS